MKYIVEFDEQEMRTFVFNSKDKEHIRSFIERYSDLIDEKDFDTLYSQQCTKDLGYSVNTITGIMLLSDINPLMYLKNTIPEDMFNSLPITGINIPDHIEIIGEYAFFYCDKLETVSLPKSLTKIYSNAFGGCEKLKNVIYNGTAQEWKDKVRINPSVGKLKPTSYLMNDIK